MFDQEHKPEPRESKPVESLNKGGGAKKQKPVVKDLAGSDGNVPELKPAVKDPSGGHSNIPEPREASPKTELTANLEQLNQAIDARTDLSEANKLA